jgi:CRP-like cAMP-binding protein
VQQGDICSYSSFVVSGCTKTFYMDADGQEHIVMFSIEDWWTSDMGSFISQTPADYNVQCIENTELIQFSYDIIEELYLEIPKLERFFRKIIERALVASQKRIVRNFSLSAKEQYLLFKENYPKIEQRIPQYMIASYLGITKEFLSKIKSELILKQ